MARSGSSNAANGMYMPVSTDTGASWLSVYASTLPRSTHRRGGSQSIR